MSELWNAYLPSENAADINRERMQTYGDPRPNYEILAKLISPILGIDVTPEQAVMIMVQVKVMREVCGGFLVGYNDNLEDICGFSNVLHVVKERRDGPA
jgi:hypothetical protein